MKLRMIFMATLLTLIVSGGVARAGYTYVITDANNDTTQAYTINVGQTLTVYLYVAQTGTSTGLTTSGLASGGVQLNTSIPSVATVTSVTPNTTANGGQFDTGSSTTGASAYATVTQVFSAPVVAPTSGTNANRILIGEFTFTGESAGSTITVTAVPSTGSNVNVLGNGTSIDSMLAANPISASITVVAVPEPSSMALGGLAVAGLAGGVFRRLRKNKPETTPSEAVPS
jgi:hypothetical protein